jgi:Ca-activated chloride channel family protein
MRNALILLAIALLSINIFGQTATEGTLYAVSKKGTELGSVPLKDTKVNASISGFIARVNVRQEFTNSFSEPIEAVYVFPLSQNGAVDNMTMTVGTRTIRSTIMKREEARQVYETAKAAGQTASLLDQERPNIFTQAVANIMPGESVIIDISYVENLKYEDGQYEFVFPMTVAPRYSPGSVVDAGKIAPPVAASRAGHDISIQVNLNAGVPVEAIRSSSHDITQTNLSPESANVSLTNEKTIPNKDFILRYDVSGKRLEDGILTHRGTRGGFFTLMLQPPDMPRSEDRTPKEIVFVLDTSGSMNGFPIEKAKEAMQLSLDGLYPEDTFNLITFAGDTRVLFEQPVPATQGNLERAKAFLSTHYGGGGTEMMKAIKASLAPSDSQEHLRIVCFMTDGMIGNEDEIVAEIQRHPKARVFSFGIGQSVNRFLLDKMAEAGRGEAEYVALEDDGSKAARKFYERVRSPLLTDLSIDWNGVAVSDVYPAKLGDLFSAKPVIVNGRYTKGGSGTIKLKGKLAGQDYVREIPISLPETETANDVLATLWARKRIDELSSEALNGKNADEINKQITSLGLEFRLLTSFTSFVAVEERIVNTNGTPSKVLVPIEIPEGVNRETTVGGDDDVIKVSADSIQNLPLNSRSTSNLMVMQPGITADVSVNGSRASKSRKVKGKQKQTGSGLGSGFGYGTGSGSPPPPAKSPGIARLHGPPMQISAGVINGKATSLPKPPYPAAARAVKASGAVSIQVTVDESGNIVSASAMSGHPLLRAAAEQAAKGAKFSPTMMSGQPVRVTGVITYNFVNPNDAGSVEIATGELSLETSPQTPEMLREQLIKDKLHSWVYALFERLQKRSMEPLPNESAFVKEGQAHLEIVLTERTQVILDQLAAIGFTIVKDDKTNTITGHIAIDRIGNLAEIAEVKLVLPRS